MTNYSFEDLKKLILDTKREEIDGPVDGNIKKLFRKELSTIVDDYSSYEAAEKALEKHFKEMLNNEDFIPVIRLNLENMVDSLEFFGPKVVENEEFMREVASLGFFRWNNPLKYSEFCSQDKDIVMQILKTSTKGGYDSYAKEGEFSVWGVGSYIHPSLLDDREVAMALVSANAWNLAFLDGFKDDKEIVLTALSNSREPVCWTVQSCDECFEIAQFIDIKLLQDKDVLSGLMDFVEKANSWYEEYTKEEIEELRESGSAILSMFPIKIENYDDLKFFIDNAKTTEEFRGLTISEDLLEIIRNDKEKSLEIIDSLNTLLINIEKDTNCVTGMYEYGNNMKINMDEKIVLNYLSTLNDFDNVRIDGRLLTSESFMEGLDNIIESKNSPSTSLYNLLGNVVYSEGTLDSLKNLPTKYKEREEVKDVVLMGMELLGVEDLSSKEYDKILSLKDTNPIEFIDEAIKGVEVSLQRYKERQSCNFDL